MTSIAKAHKIVNLDTSFTYDIKLSPLVHTTGDNPTPRFHGITFDCGIHLNPCTINYLIYFCSTFISTVIWMGPTDYAYFRMADGNTHPSINIESTISCGIQSSKYVSIY
jgi:hypothetical protein